METPTLYIFSGLPGSGKSTLSQLLAVHVGAAYVRIDTIEQELREVCSIDVQGEGYLLAYRVAADNLKLGISVVADSCNPIELTRRAWERVAAEIGVHYVNIEAVCSDLREHRRRVEARLATVPGLALPTWRDVTERQYDDWTIDRVALDTFYLNASASTSCWPRCLCLTTRCGPRPRTNNRTRRKRGASERRH